MTKGAPEIIADIQFLRRMNDVVAEGLRKLEEEVAGLAVVAAPLTITFMAKRVVEASADEIQSVDVATTQDASSEAVPEPTLPAATTAGPAQEKATDRALWDDLVRRRYEAGESIADLARAYHVARRDINAALDRSLGVAEEAKEAAAVGPDASSLEEAAPTSWEDEARRLHADGLIPFEIAKQLVRETAEVCRVVVPGFREKEERRRAARETRAKPAPVREEKPSAEGDPANREPWAAEAIRLYNSGRGLSAGAIATRLKPYGATDFKVRCLLIPGFREQLRTKIRRARGQGDFRNTQGASGTAREAPSAGSGGEASSSGTQSAPPTQSQADGGSVSSASAGVGTKDRIGAAGAETHVHARQSAQPAQPSTTKQQAEDDRLRELRGEGRSFREIAETMRREGFTTRTVNAWIGRADRLGCRPAKEQGGTVVRKVKPLPSPVPPKVPVKEPAPAPIPRHGPVPLAIEQDEGISIDLASTAPTDGPGIHILALKDRHCRWPVGAGDDGLETYCGCARSVHGGPYCEEHSIKAHQPGGWPPRTPAPKLPTRMARPVTRLPDARA